MSLEHTNTKRRWLKRILNVGAPKALWLGSALLSPVLLTSTVSESAMAQQTSVNQDASTEPAVDADFVLGWINHAERLIETKDTDGAVTAWAETLRARRTLGIQDPRVETRLKQVEKLLQAQGIKQQQVIEAYKGLGKVAAAPRPASTSVSDSSAASNSTASPLDRRDQVAALTQQAAQALQAGDTQRAQAIVAQAEQLGVPDQWMLPGQITLTQVKQHLSGVVAASATAPVTTAPPMAGPVAPVSGPVAQVAGPMGPVDGKVAPGIFQPQTDATSTQMASSQVEVAVPAPVGGVADGDSLYRRGLELLSKGDRDAAYDHFRRAWQFNGEMEPGLRNQLKDKLTSMQAANIQPEQIQASPVQQLSNEQLALRQSLMSEMTREIAEAEANREAEPQLVAERLQTLRTRISQANLDGDARKRMLTIVDRAITSHQIYISQNQATIDQNLRNRQVTEKIALDQEERIKLDQQIASMVETYNDLMDKGDFLQAEVVAKQVGALDRDSTIAKLLIANSRNARRIGEYEDIKSMKEDKFVDAMINVDEASVPFDDRNPQLWPDAREWDALTKSRAKLVRESEQGMSPAEAIIWEKLKMPVLVDFQSRPLGEVARTLSDMTGVLIHVDENGLALEGLTSETPVTLSLPSQISLRSALNLLLNTQNLDFQVRNEVLLITSARNLGEANVQRVYNVKDLVIPIPNFATDYNTGMAGALRQAYETVNNGLVARAGGNPLLPSQVQLASASLDPDSGALGQLGTMPMGGPMGAGIDPYGGLMGNAPLNMGSPSPLGGGGAITDFGTLMNLITQTVDPDTWLQNGGSSTLLPYQYNLSLVVSAPQTTHEKIADLLESLRRLQDLQVTIEVKFITLNDNFFERMGVDFDLRIDDNSGGLPLDDQGPSTVVGLSSNVTATTPFPLTADLDVAFSQDSFASATPAFGGFDAGSGAQLGFAILSDLEMFFFMNAAQGDQRTNILQAPRVTMFDGQAATINDTTQRPFVTGLTPIVGDFAVAQMPVIVVLNEGTVLNVQATVSPDKRFVRLTLNPNFSQIDRVDTFTFEGSRTTRTGSTRAGTNILDPTGTVDNSDEDTEEIIVGSTVQQPSLASTFVTTTVSVPDGGTILLGGIKRMREGRIERGVPILSKIPYVNRLFKNTSIGRETSTLMMTVTPRIIIQEEEEEKYGVNKP